MTSRPEDFQIGTAGLPGILPRVQRAVVCRAPRAWLTGVQFALLLAATLLMASPTPKVRAAEIDDVTFPDAANAFGEDLALFSCGLRELLWTEVYAVSFYLPNGHRSAEALWDSGVAKLIRVEIIYGGDIPDGLPQEWRYQLKQVLNRDVLSTFRDLYDDLAKDDVLVISYGSNQQVSVSLNGERITALSGHDLVEALLELWIGHKPVSKNLRRLLSTKGC